MRRFQIDISNDQKTLLDEYIKWGDLSPLFRVIIDDLLEILQDEKHRQALLGMIASGKVKAKDWSQVVAGLKLRRIK